MSKFSPNTLHLENSEEAAIVVSTAHHYCAASSGHEECGASDRRPSSQVSASQLRAANHWKSIAERIVSCALYRVSYRIVGSAYRFSPTRDVFWCDIVSVDQIAYGKCDCGTVISTMIFYRSLVSESSVTGLGVHNRWWMYDNITLHSLCYLARVRPVHFTLGRSGKFSRQAALWRWLSEFMVNARAFWCDSTGSKSKKHDKILTQNYNVLPLNLIYFLVWVAPVERILFCCYCSMLDLPRDLVGGSSSGSG